MAEPAFDPTAFEASAFEVGQRARAIGGVTTLSLFFFLGAGAPAIPPEPVAAPGGPTTLSLLFFSG